MGDLKEEKTRVLILDDERLVRFTTGAFLKSAGFEIVEAASPAEAVGALRHGSFDVIVSDVGMGDVDGFLFREMVRSFNKDIPIVFLTAMGSDEGDGFFSRLSEDIRSYYVSKSASKQLLVTRLRQVTEFSRMCAQVKKSREELEKSLSLASCVQRSMLPHWSRVSDVYAYSCRILPLAQISGDLMEWYRPTEQTSLVIFGDVSGHGANAALAMTAIQAFLKQFKHVDVETARRIHFIASLVHDFIMKNLREVAYLTATFVFADFEHETVRYLNCGNPEPFIARLGDGTRREVNPKRMGGLPLGLMPDSKYTAEDVVEIPFKAGDVYIQYSDGLMDISKDAAGFDRLPDGMMEELCAMSVRDQSPGEPTFCELPYRLLGALSDMGFVHRQDDMSVCAFTPFEPPDGMSYRTRVRMRPENIDQACHKAAEWVAQRFKSEELGVKVDLLLNEYLMNIHRHGYDAFRRQREVSILGIRENDGKVQVWIWDRGFPWDKIASASQAEAEAKLEEQNENLEGNGRGQAIMCMIADQIHRTRVGDLNRTVFEIALPQPDGQV